MYPLKRTARRIRARFGSVKELLGTVVLLAMIVLATVLVYLMTKAQ
jgi:hypothetical protein